MKTKVEPRDAVTASQSDAYRDLVRLALLSDPESPLPPELAPLIGGPSRRD